ncbi:MAG: hypothetical protein OEW75_00055 [Cyclobacteriaceae bacterium]|nr:hypothetical protein [Cyclobacteriaceae bacterium]
MNKNETLLRKLYFGRKYRDLIGILSIVGFFTTLLIALMVIFVLEKYMLGIRVLIGSLVFVLCYLLNFKGYTFLSRLLISWLIPLAVVVISVTEKIDMNFDYSVTPEDYFSARIILITGIIYPILTIGYMEKKLFIASILPTIICLLFFDPIHYYYNVGYNEIGLNTAIYVKSNLYTFISFGFIISSVFYYKVRSESSEFEQYLNNNKNAQVLSSLATFANSNSLLSGNTNNAIMDACSLIWQCTNSNLIGLWFFDTDNSLFINKGNFLGGKYFSNHKFLDREKYEKLYTMLLDEKHKNLTALNLNFTFWKNSTSALGSKSRNQIITPFYGEFDDLKGFIVCENDQLVSDEWNSIFIHSVCQLIQKGYIFAMLEKQQTEITSLNFGLEEQVNLQTRELKDKNKKLIDFAFMNSHVLRAPITRILGLINVMELSKTQKEKEEVMQLLKETTIDLEKITQEMSRAVEFVES